MGSEYNVPVGAKNENVLWETVGMPMGQVPQVQKRAGQVGFNP